MVVGVTGDSVNATYTLIMFAMPEQSVNSINFYAVIALYFIIGAKLEEARLILAHPEYEDYRRRVAAFIPFVKNF